MSEASALHGDEPAGPESAADRQTSDKLNEGQPAALVQGDDHTDLSISEQIQERRHQIYEVQPSATPRPEYARFPKAAPYAAIPRPSQAATDSAITNYEKYQRSDPDTVRKFEEAFAAWKETWSHVFSNSALDRCEGEKYEKLFAMGPRILPLVVYTLLMDYGNFTAVFLYNDLEEDTRYCIDPKRDIINFLTLQLQSSLVVEVNTGREWPWI